MTAEAACGACGANTVVSGACVACGAGVAYRVRRRYGPKKKRAHRHVWGYVGITFETGDRRRKEKCTAGECPSTRLIEVGS